MNIEPVIVEIILNTTPKKIWEAITTKEAIKQWSFDIISFEPTVGFEFTILGGKDPENQYLHLCKIVEVIPEQKLSYTWQYDGFEGNSLVIFDITPLENNQVQLRLSHNGIETFPESNPDFAKHNFEAGWKQIIGVSLKALIEK